MNIAIFKIIFDWLKMRSKKVIGFSIEIHVRRRICMNKQQLLYMLESAALAYQDVPSHLHLQNQYNLPLHISNLHCVLRLAADFHYMILLILNRNIQQRLITVLLSVKPIMMNIVRSLTRQDNKRFLKNFKSNIQAMYK